MNIKYWVCSKCWGVQSYPRGICEYSWCDECWYEHLLEVEAMLEAGETQ